MGEVEVEAMQKRFQPLDSVRHGLTASHGARWAVMELRWTPSRRGPQAWDEGGGASARARAEKIAMAWAWQWHQPPVRCPLLRYGGCGDHLCETVMWTSDDADYASKLPICFWRTLAGTTGDEDRRQVNCWLGESDVFWAEASGREWGTSSRSRMERGFMRRKKGYEARPQGDGFTTVADATDEA